jgi:undecaprenyl-diphosphatase
LATRLSPQQRLELRVPLLQIVVIAILQGITEFLPISSSGHLVILPSLTGWPDQGTLIDVAVHVGTLVAVVFYFRRDLLQMIVGLVRLGRSDAAQGARLLVNLVIATLPVVAVGALVHQSGLTSALRSVEVVGWTTLVFGVVLFVADRLGMTFKRLEHMRAGGALIVGLAQVLALIPGTSRAGITMTAARGLGFERQDTARFSMLLSIPTIAAAGTLGGLDIYASGDLRLGLDALLAAGFACATALAAIALMMAWLRRATFTPFVIYRAILGIALLTWAYA